MDQDALGLPAYLNAIGTERLLTSAEEITLAQAIQAGDRAARDRLITANLRLVVAMAHRYEPVCDVPLEDLVQAGNLGLLRAAQRFDPSLGYRFSTFATWWIRQAIVRMIGNLGRLIRIPIYLQTAAHKLRCAKRDTQTPDEPINPDEVGVSVAEFQRLATLPQRPLSLDQPLDNELGGTLGEWLIASEQGVAEQVETAHLRVALVEAMAHLLPRERTVLALRFGLEIGASMTLNEVGAHLGLSRERVRQLEARALSKLRIPAVLAILSDWVQ